ncbi:uncharacterized protein DSM5745_04879 [Aspergillus mulundensis]|uniref:Uncharacterized protein n=1 Tax=Aspergillus mulundensis TaxID=1810919 RepID=A0A3D8S4V0_9EURO|nr:hypothetical protein DSM5745_04879 [Aspergillus mulundensis]RDW81322.1 hypothetical protein DSM5745_04879 [Aspergillus mulundensis]
MLIPIPLRQLELRQSSDPREPPNNGTDRNDDSSQGGGGGPNSNVVIIVVAVVVFAVAFLAIVYFVLRALRRMDCRPKYIPGKFLKDRWTRWNVGASYGQVPGGSSSNRAGATATAQTTEGAPQTESNAGIRRDTSIRSIITLPAYSSTPKPTEQVIAREGERGGMDMVVEFPETAEEEEDRREEMMESLYQIRLQRRQEIADREARRRERREARERGDSLRLEQLRVESRRARANSRESVNGNTTSVSAATALAEAQSRGRDRRISSVTYADVGYVRHDGSRLRASSRDSDSRPLLNDAAGMSEGPDRSSGLISVHSRGESYSSALSDGEGLTLTQSHTTSLHSVNNPNAEPEDGDVGTRHIPPPDYDHLDWGDAPPYEPPTSSQTDGPPRLRELTTLPTIQIDVVSPVSNEPPTPIPQAQPQEPTPATAASSSSHSDSTSSQHTPAETTRSSSPSDSGTNPPRG